MTASHTFLSLCSSCERPLHGLPWTCGHPACLLHPSAARRFLVLVTGTLVYGKGDKLDARREGLLETGEERVFAPVATAVPGEAQPSAVPGQRRSSVGTAPIAMRATPGSLKVCCQPCARPAGTEILPVTLIAMHCPSTAGGIAWRDSCICR